MLTIDKISLEWLSYFSCTIIVEFTIMFYMMEVPNTTYIRAMEGSSFGQNVNQTSNSPDPWKWKNKLFHNKQLNSKQTEFNTLYLSQQTYI